MNSERVHFVLDLAIHEGKFDEVAALVKSMTAGTAKETGAFEYEWYLSKDNNRCRLVEIYADVEAMKAHLASSVVGELVPKLLGFATLDRFEVYGTPDEQSAAILASVGAEIFRHWHGLESHRPIATGTAAG
jgi:quinol monooxygenase YgiN